MIVVGRSFIFFVFLFFDFLILFAFFRVFFLVVLQSKCQLGKW
jgi:hypothetical protein